MKSERIKYLRLERGMNRETLAKELGVSLSALATYERGEREPGATLIVKLAKHFHVTSDYLLGLSDTPKAAKEWPSSVPASAAQSVSDIKDSVEEMISSANLNPYGIQTLDAYATIINHLSGIDAFAVKQLVELQKTYPNFRQFGTEGKMLFDSQELLLALANGSKEASEFAKLLTSATSRIYNRILEIRDIIGQILEVEVLDSIKGQPIEHVLSQNSTETQPDDLPALNEKYESARKIVRKLLGSDSDDSAPADGESSTLSTDTR